MGCAPQSGTTVSVSGRLRGFGAARVARATRVSGFGAARAARVSGRGIARAARVSGLRVARAARVSEHGRPA